MMLWQFHQLFDAVQEHDLVKELIEGNAGWLPQPCDLPPLRSCQALFLDSQ